MQPISNITPLNVSKPAIKAEVQRVIFEFNPNRYAYALIFLLDEDNRIVTSYEVDFTLEEMNSWGVDDNYVLELSLQKLGIQL
jgi:hypothetical protein